MGQKFNPILWTFVAGTSSLSFGCSGTPDSVKEQVGCTTQHLTAGSGSAPTLTALSWSAPSASSARLVLSDSLVARLKKRAASGDAAWTELKNRCDGYATGTMNPPSGNAYPDAPDVGQGYQGEEYLPVIRALGLCYRTETDPAAQARYGDAGARLLEAMSTPADSGGQSPSTDSGYGIRNYVVGMAFGYDWLRPALSASLKSRVASSMNAWIDWYDQNGFIHDDPIGNYFAGYFLAKTAAALATEGDNAKATTYWNDVVTRMWGQLVKPQFETMMKGGGWPEGWGYGKKAVLSMVEALWAVETAKGLGWVKTLPLAHDEAAYVRNFAWPSLKHMDDRGTIRSGINPRPSSELVLGLATAMEALGDPSAPVARGFAADVIATDDDDSVPWTKFLYGDATMPKADYKAGSRSHFASGPGHVAMRSSWDKNATWGALSGGTYINAGDSGEQLYDTGSVSVVVGDQPLLINPTGWLPQNAGTDGENFVYNDGYGDGGRRLYNTFFVDDASNPHNPGQSAFGPSVSKAHVDRFEDRGEFVHSRGVDLGDQYGGGVISQFTRDVLYVRPGAFVLFDRTTVAQAGADQWLSFHTPVAASQGATSDPTQHRFDVAVGGAQLGSIRSLLPRNANTSTTSLPASAADIEVHAPEHAASQQWLTVVTAGAGTGDQVRLSSADGNVASGNMVGVELAAPQSAVVLFASDQGATGTVATADYTVQQAAGTHVLVDVAPSTSGYAVTATPSNGKFRIQVTGGGPLQASVNKTLSFTVSAAGAVSAPPSAAAPSPTPAPTDPPAPTAPSTSPAPSGTQAPSPTPSGTQAPSPTPSGTQAPSPTQGPSPAPAPTDTAAPTTPTPSTVPSPSPAPSETPAPSGTPVTKMDPC